MGAISLNVKHCPGAAATGCRRRHTIRYPFGEYVYVGDLRSPICFDPVSAPTIVRHYELRHKLGLGGKNADEIAKGVEAAYAIGDLPKVEASIAYNGALWCL